MNSNIDELYKENEKHDCAIITCEGTKDFVLAVRAFFFSIRAYVYDVYRLDSEDDLTTNNEQKEKCIYFISDMKDGKSLERDLYIAKISYQLKDTHFFPRQEGLSYIKSISNMPYLVMRYSGPGNVMGLQCCLLTARQGMVLKLPQYVYFSKSLCKRYFDLYESMVNHKENTSDNDISKVSVLETENDFIVLSKIIKNKIGLDLCYCPSGSFVIGSPEDEIGRLSEYGHEENQQKIEISKPFMICKFPIVGAQFKYLADSELLKEYDSGSSLRCREDKICPVTMISYKAALRFCDLLNEKLSGIIPENYCFCLPTESQWEYACRAGTTTAFNNGKNLSKSKEESEKILDEIAWYKCGQPLSVGLKEPNSWNLYDMHGNVCEWCVNDLKRTSEDGKIFDAIAKGGSYLNEPASCRSAAWLGFNGKHKQHEYVGFRIALVPVG